MIRFCLAFAFMSLIASSAAPTARAQDALADAPTESIPAAPTDGDGPRTGDATRAVDATRPADSTTSSDVSPSAEHATSLRAPMPTASDAADPDAADLDSADDDSLPPPLAAIAEIAIGTTPTLGFGLAVAGTSGLSTLDGFGIGGRTDFAFAASPRIFFGFGLNVVHQKTARSESTGGLTLNRLSLPLIAQIYLDTPRRGATVPTLRITPALRWAKQVQETFDGIEFRTTRTGTLGGQLEVAIGITWFVVDALAVRLLGDIGVTADVSTSGRNSSSVNAYVGADIGVVIRL